MVYTNLNLRICIAGYCIILISFLSRGYAQEYQWGQSMGSTHADQIQDMATDKQGNVYVIGSFQKELNVNASLVSPTFLSAGKEDILVAKFDSLGRVVWAFHLGGSGKDLGNSLALDFSGNLYITGSFENSVDFNPGNSNRILNAVTGSDAFLAKYDTSGNHLWSFQIGGEEGVGSGKKVRVNSDNTVILSGYFGGKADFNPGEAEFNLHPTGGFVAKYDSKSVFQWAFALSGNDGVLNIEDLALDFQGNVYLTGYMGGLIDFSNNITPQNIKSKGVADIFVAKYDQNANYQWAFSIGEPEGVASAQALAVDKLGNVAITGYYWGKMDFDPSASTKNLTSSASTDIFLAKYNKSGQYLWAKSMGSSEGDAGTALAYDDASNLFVTGYFSGTMDANPGVAQNLLNSNRLADIFLIKFNINGDHQSAFKIGGVDFDRSYALVYGVDRSLYLGGYFRQNIGLNPTDVGLIKSSRGDRDMFVAKYKQALPSTFYVESFMLYDADKDIPLQTLQNGDIIDINAYSSLNLSIRVNTVPPTVGSVEIILEGGFNSKKTENTSPYTLFGDNGSDNLTGSLFCPDSYNLFAQPYSQLYKGGSLGEGRGINFRLQGGGLLDSLILINADTDLSIRPLNRNDTINLEITGLNLSMQATTTCASGVYFEVRDSLNKVIIARSEQTPPFSLLGDNGLGNYNPWSPTPGKYSLLVRPFRNQGGQVTRGANQVYNFRVIPGLPPSVVPEAQSADSFLQTVYPNPSLDNRLNFVFKPLPTDEKLLLKVDNAFGETLLQKEIQTKSTELEYRLDLNQYNLAQGLYFVSIWHQGKALRSYRIIKYN